MDVSQHGEEAYASGEGSILVPPEALASEPLVMVPVPGHRWELEARSS
jgi:hypothetical protein